MSRSDWWPSYPRRRRLAVKDGVQARKGNKGFATRWWARKWLEALERIAGPSRLARGRTYARRGQVMDYQVSAGVVTAKVQGSRRTPYEVRIALAAFRDLEWAAALKALAAQAGFAAELLAGRMPEEVESAFQAAGVSLMPVQAAELKTSCSCPDQANPCKHVAAVHYLLAEAFDDDPFLLFRLRGRGREQVLGELARLWGGPEEAEGSPVSAGQPLPADPAAFWGGPTPLPPLDFAEPPLWGAHLLAFGSPGPWTTPGELRAALEPALREAGVRARQVMEGGAEEAPAEPPSVEEKPGPRKARRASASSLPSVEEKPGPRKARRASTSSMPSVEEKPAPRKARRASTSKAASPARLEQPALLHWRGDSAVLIHLPAGPLQRFGPGQGQVLVAWLKRLPEVLCVGSEEEVRAAFPTVDLPARRLEMPSATVEGPRAGGATLDEALELLTGTRLEEAPGPETLVVEALALHQLWRYRALHGYLPVLRRGQPRRCREEGAGEPDAALRDLVRRALDSLAPLRLLVDPPGLPQPTEAAEPPLPKGVSRTEASLLREAETLVLPDPLAGASDFQPLVLDADGFSGVWLEDGEDASYHFMEVLDARGGQGDPTP